MLFANDPRVIHGDDECFLFIYFCVVAFYTRLVSYENRVCFNTGGGGGGEMFRRARRHRANNTVINYVLLSTWVYFFVFYFLYYARFLPIFYTYTFLNDRKLKPKKPFNYQTLWSLNKIQTLYHILNWITCYSFEFFTLVYSVEKVFNDKNLDIPNIVETRFYLYHCWGKKRVLLTHFFNKNNFYEWNILNVNSCVYYKLYICVCASIHTVYMSNKCISFIVHFVLD